LQKQHDRPAEAQMSDAPVVRATEASNEFLNKLIQGDFAMETSVLGSKSQQDVFYIGADESMQVRADAAQLSIVDSLHQRLIQVDALISMLCVDSAQNPDGFTFSHSIVTNSLWATQSLLRQATEFADKISIK